MFNTPTGSRYQPIVEESSYKVSMRIMIYNVTSKDFGTYRCVCKNSLGDTEGTIKLYSTYQHVNEKHHLTKTFPGVPHMDRSATFLTSSGGYEFELPVSWGVGV